MIGSATCNADPQAPAIWLGDLDVTFLGGHRVTMNGPGSLTRICAPELSGKPCVGEPTSPFIGTPFG